MRIKILLAVVIVLTASVSPALSSNTSAQTQSSTETIIIGGTMNGYVVFLDDDGQITNTIQIGAEDEIVRGVAIADNGYYAAVNHSLYYIQDGQANHIYTHDDYITAIASIGSDIVMGGLDGNVKRIDSSGNIAWNKTGFSGIQDMETGVGDAGKFIWVSSAEGGGSHLTRYNWTNGNSDTAIDIIDGPGRGTAAISPTKAAMTTSDGAHMLLVATIGSGHNDHGRVIERYFPEHVTENNGIVYMGMRANNEDGIVAYNYETSTLLYQTPDNTYSNIREIHYENGSLYTASKNSFQKVDPADGTQIWNASGSPGETWSLRAETVEVTHTVSGTVTDSNNSPLENVSVTIEQDGSTVANTSTNSEGNYSVELGDGSYTAIFSKEEYGTVEKDFTISGESVTLSATLEKVELVVEVQKWMYPNTTQTYKGIYLPESGYQIVTSELNVTSSNTSVVAVNESSNELIAQPGVNNTANVTFRYNELEVTKEIAVAHRTLEYIHLLPSTQWASAVLGIDDAGTEYGMGSEIQWIFVAIILASLLAAIGSNEWIGLGTIIITMSLFWILEYISLGMVLASLFFGLFLAFTLLEIPKGNTTEVTVEENNIK